MRLMSNTLRRHRIYISRIDGIILLILSRAVTCILEFGLLYLPQISSSPLGQSLTRSHTFDSCIQYMLPQENRSVQSEKKSKLFEIYVDMLLIIDYKVIAQKNFFIQRMHCRTLVNCDLPANPQMTLYTRSGVPRNIILRHFEYHILRRTLEIVSFHGLFAIGP